MAKRVQSLYDWCIENGEYGQLLLNEWTGICEDGNIYNSYEVNAKSKDLKVKWVCSTCGESWFTLIYSRTIDKTRCKYCTQREAQLNRGVNDLYTWCASSENKDYGSRILYEFGNGDNSQQYTNKNGKILTANDYTCKSTIEVGWKCKDCGNRWIAPIKYRTGQHVGCIVLQQGIIAKITSGKRLQ